MMFLYQLVASSVFEAEDGISAFVGHGGTTIAVIPNSHHQQYEQQNATEQEEHWTSTRQKESQYDLVVSEDGATRG